MKVSVKFECDRSVFGCFQKSQIYRECFKNTILVPACAVSSGGDQLSRLGKHLKLPGELQHLNIKKSWFIDYNYETKICKFQTMTDRVLYTSLRCTVTVVTHPTCHRGYKPLSHSQKFSPELRVFVVNFVFEFVCDDVCV